MKRDLEWALKQKADQLDNLEQWIKAFDAPPSKELEQVLYLARTFDSFGRHPKIPRIFMYQHMNGFDPDIPLHHACMIFSGAVTVLLGTTKSKGIIEVAESGQSSPELGAELPDIHPSVLGIGMGLAETLGLVNFIPMTMGGVTAEA